MFSVKCFPSSVVRQVFSVKRFPSSVFRQAFSVKCFLSRVFRQAFSAKCCPSIVFLSYVRHFQNGGVFRQQGNWVCFLVFFHPGDLVNTAVSVCLSACLSLSVWACLSGGQKQHKHVKPFNPHLLLIAPGPLEGYTGPLKGYIGPLKGYIGPFKVYIEPLKGYIDPIKGNIRECRGI